MGTCIFLAWDRSTVHKTDTHARFWNMGGGSVLGTSTGFTSNVIQNNSEAVRYSQNLIIRSKHDASARHPKIHAIPYAESTVTA